jgi:hypothetical protein
MNNVENRVSKIASQIDGKIWIQVGEIGIQVGKIGKQVGNQVWSKVRNPIVEQTKNQLWIQVIKQVNQNVKLWRM